jgi:RNA polymerase sigma-70 factor (ECF subfamily)
MLGPGAQGSLDRSAIVQSTLKRIWQRIEETFPENPDDVALRRFLGLISTIVRNRTWDECRKQRRRRVEGAGSDVADVVDPRPAERARKRDRLAVELAAALARLPDRDRQVVELFWFEGLSDAEISTRLGCSSGAARVIRFRALRKLQTPELEVLLEDSHDD